MLLQTALEAREFMRRLAVRLSVQLMEAELERTAVEAISEGRTTAAATARGARPGTIAARAGAAVRVAETAAILRYSGASVGRNGGG